MANHYKIDVRGTALSQETNMSLYMGRGDGTNVEESIQAYDDVIDAYLAQIDAAYRAVLSDEWTGQSIQVTIVNELSEVQSSFPYEVDYNGSGGDSGGLETVAMCAIVALKCMPIQAAQTARVPKGSYVAVGPLTVFQTNPDGRLTSGTVNNLKTFGQAVADFNAIVGAEAYGVTSTRVGVASEVPPTVGIGAEGEVVLSVVRPYCSIRRSRLISPTGQ